MDIFIEDSPIVVTEAAAAAWVALVFPLLVVSLPQTIRCFASIQLSQLLEFVTVVGAVSGWSDVTSHP